LNIGTHSERCPLDTMRKAFLSKLAETAAGLQQQLI
jgi:hypothetical protein